jgi:hypothetical protein
LLITTKTSVRVPDDRRTGILQFATLRDRDNVFGTQHISPTGEARHIEVKDAAAIVAHDEKAVQQLERHGRNREEIHCGRHFAVVVQECEPTLGGLGASRGAFYPSGDSALGYVEGERPRMQSTGSCYRAWVVEDNSYAVDLKDGWSFGETQELTAIFRGARMTISGAPSIETARCPSGETSPLQRAVPKAVDPGDYQSIAQKICAKLWTPVENNRVDSRATT